MARSMATAFGFSHSPRVQHGLPRLLILFVLTLSVGLAPFAGVRAHAARQADAGLASLAPESTVVFSEINLDRTSDQWQRAEALLARAGFPTAFDDVERALADALGANFTDANPFLGGTLAFVVMEPAIERLLANPAFASPPGGPAATPRPSAAPAATGVAAIVMPDDLDAAWQVIEDQLRAPASGPGTTVTETEYQGVTVLSSPMSGSAPFGAAALLDETIVVAAAPADIEPVIDTALGNQPALSGLPALTELRTELPSDALIFSFVNSARFTEFLGTDVEAATAALAPQLAGMPATDLFIGMAVWADDPGFRIDTVSALPPGGQPPPLPQNAPITFDERVGADALFFFGGSGLEVTGVTGSYAFNVAQLITMSFGMGGTPVPASLEMQLSPDYINEQFAAAEALLGFDLRDDLFGLIEGEFAFAFSLGTLFIGPPDLSGLLVADVREPDRVAESLQRLARLIEREDADTDISVRRIDGDTIYTLSPAPDDPDTSPVVSVLPANEFGVLDDQIVAGLGSGIDDYVRGPRQSLAGNEQYQRVMAELPAEHSQIVYVDLGQIVDLVTRLQQQAEGTVVDAAPACADYPTQARAQEAYGREPLANANLDQDFDGQVCEDFFAAATPGATPVPVGSYDAIEAFASVTYARDGLPAASSILYIAEQP